MNVKINFFNLRLVIFPANIGPISEMSTERNNNTLEIVKMYQGHWKISMITDYCWRLHCTNSESPHIRDKKKMQPISLGKKNSISLLVKKSILMHSVNLYLSMYKFLNEKICFICLPLFYIQHAILLYIQLQHAILYIYEYTVG